MRRIALLLAALLTTGAAPTTPAERLDRSTFLVPGGFESGHQPDGNSILLLGRDGVILFDTGRHAAHVDAVEQAIAATGKPLVAIINSHWHLDHVSGNLAIKARHPGVKVWASDAIDGALTGFLKRSAEQGRGALDHGDISEPMAGDVRGDLSTIARGQELRPDRVVRQSGSVRIAGRWLRLNLAHRAATAADVWVYDPRSRRVLAGDLVTMPVPFLDTACPNGWREALRQVAATPFRALVPGHGRVMDRPAFLAWRTAFDALIDCGEDPSRPKTACGADWIRYAASVETGGVTKRLSAMTEYYVDLLRSGELRRNCAS